MRTPLTPRDQLVRDPLYGSGYIQLRDQDRPVQPHEGWKVKGPKLEHCATCGMSWPCEPGLALKIIDRLLVWLASPSRA
jgi:hypothetical protein